MTTRHILVTGGAGFIGSHVCRLLLERGDTVTCVDNFDPFYPRNQKLANLRSLLVHGTPFSLIEADLAVDGAVDEVLSVRRYDAVLHLAARAGVLPSIEEPGTYLQANIVATHQLLSAMRRHGPFKLVFASSSSVYGDSTDVPFSEDAPCDRPISPYAYTKRSCELACHTFHHLFGIDVVCARLFTVYGPGQRPDLAISKFVSLAERGRPIPVYGDGSTGRDYTYVGDAARGLVASADYLLGRMSTFEIINLGSHAPILLRDLIDAVERALGKPVRRRFLPRQPGDVAVTFADISKARQLLKYEPQTKLADGLERYISSTRGLAVHA